MYIGKIMRRIYLPLVLLNLLFGHCTSIAQSTEVLPAYEVAFHALGVNEGLSQGLVMGITQDRTGFMWFATKDGLNKYDGYKFTCYRNSPKDPYSLPDNYITNVVCDSNGNLWISTQTKGVYIFDDRKERFYHVPFFGNPSDERDVEILILESKGNTLLLTDDKSACLFDVSRIQRWQYTPYSLLSFRKIFETPFSPLRMAPLGLYHYTIFADGSIGYAIQDTIGVYSPGTKTGQWEHQYFLLSDLGIKATAYTKLRRVPGTHHILIVSEKTLAVVDPDQHKVLFRNDFSGDVALTPENDVSGKFWLNNKDNLIFDPTSLALYHVIDRNNALPGLTYSFLCGFTDRNGRIWLGTNGYGVLNFDPWSIAFRKYHGEKILRADTVLLLRKINDGRVVAINPVTGTQQDLLPAGNPINSILLDTRISSCIRDAEGVYWLSYPLKGGNIASVKNVNGHAEVRYADAPGLFNYGLIIPDRDNTLWLVPDRFENNVTLYHFDKKQMKIIGNYDLPVKYPFDSRPAMDYYEDDIGTFWLANEAGLFRFDPNHKIGSQVWRQWVHHENDSTSLPYSKITTICPDPQEPGKYLWVGTNGAGFARFEINTGRCITYTETDGLANNVVCGIRSGEVGNLWISTNRGLSCFNPTTHYFRNFSEDDGLSSNEFNFNGFAKSATGELFFYGVKGLTSFRPKDVLRTRMSPPTAITDISVFNRLLVWKSDTLNLDAAVPYTNSLRITHEQNMFTISFAALEYTDGRKKHYQYRLEGYDHQWIDSRAKNEATYTHIPPGSYTFQVKAAGLDGEWNDMGASLNVIMLPAWWQTWWFRSLVAGAMVLVIYLLFRYRLKQKMQILALRNRIADDLHDEIGSTLSSISLLSTAAKQTMSQKPNEAANMLSKISDGTIQMMESMSDIVWTINAKNDRLSELVNRMRAFASEVMEARNVSLHMDIQNDILSLPLTMLQRKDVYLIFKEAVNNAAKYSDCKNFTVSMSMKGEKKMRLELNDDGIGFGPVKESLGGNGLVSMQRRTEDLKGELKIESEPQKGTRIVLEFSVG